MSDPSKPIFDPQKPGSQADQPDQTGQTGPGDPQVQPQQQGPQAPQEDVELITFLIDEHGHTEHSAKQELKNNREGVKQKHKQHKEKRGK